MGSCPGRTGRQQPALARARCFLGSSQPAGGEFWTSPARTRVQWLQVPGKTREGDPRAGQHSRTPSALLARNSCLPLALKPEQSGFSLHSGGWGRAVPCPAAPGCCTPSIAPARMRMDTGSCPNLRAAVSPHPRNIPTVLLAGSLQSRTPLPGGIPKKMLRSTVPTRTSCRCANITSDGPSDVTEVAPAGAAAPLAGHGELPALPIRHFSHWDGTQPFRLQPNPGSLPFTAAVRLHSRILVPVTPITAVTPSPTIHTTDAKGPKNKGQVTVKWGLVG